MAGKGKKKRKESTATSGSNGAANGAANGNGGNAAEPGKKKGKKKKEGKSYQCDIFNDAAMENAYYVCHNVQDVLKCRGFPWPEAQKKKKKGKR